ncbi:hypothetical protein PIB30_108435 [Stylosanthes scabra]|uniref:Uncharacterized protein n=1 Tax=Stylosanthes scabra TaxID=79078 RepID=A0ABU6R0U3_9FABA|nr:hypothetical protein [Stylosanthes scabra]
MTERGRQSAAQQETNNTGSSEIPFWDSSAFMSSMTSIAQAIQYQAAATHRALERIESLHEHSNGRTMDEEHNRPMTLTEFMKMPVSGGKES